MATDLSTVTPPKPKPKRRPKSKQRGRKNRLGHGRTSNPGGRPESLAGYVRRVTKNGILCVDFMVSIAKGIPIQKVRRVPNEDPNQPAHEYLYHETPDAKDRMDAVKWLVDRGFGKAAEIIELTGKPAFNLIFLGHRRDPVTSGELDRPALPPANPPDT